jgi:hypothetical protein
MIAEVTDDVLKGFEAAKLEVKLKPGLSAVCARERELVQM